MLFGVTMKKVAVMFLAFVALSLQSLPAIANQYAYSCYCASGPKKCNQMESLFIFLKTSKELVAKVTCDDWDCDEYRSEARASRYRSSKPYALEHTVFVISSDRSDLPALYRAGDLLIENEMKTGGKSTPDAPNYGKAYVISKKGNVLLQYFCKAMEPKYF